MKGLRFHELRTEGFRLHDVGQGLQDFSVILATLGVHLGLLCLCFIIIGACGLNVWCGCFAYGAHLHSGAPWLNAWLFCLFGVLPSCVAVWFLGASWLTVWLACNEVVLYVPDSMCRGLRSWGFGYLKG